MSNKGNAEMTMIKLMGKVRPASFEFFDVVIGPKLAKSLLELNTDNRKLRKLEAQKYAREMALQRWQHTPETIIITQSGVVRNGQHRLSAVVESGKSIKFTLAIVPDAKKDVFSVLDCGVSRTISDLLKSGDEITIPLKYLLRATGTKTPTAFDVDVLQDNTLGRALIGLSSAGKVTGRIWRQNTFKAAYALAVAAGQVEEQDAIETYMRLVHGPISDWPKLFQDLYAWVSDRTDRQINRTGVSLANDYFMRGLFAFVNMNSRRKKIILTDEFKSWTDRTAKRVVLGAPAENFTNNFSKAA